MMSDKSDCEKIEADCVRGSRALRVAEIMLEMFLVQ